MKVAIDPGHGMSNRKAGVFDPGATDRVGGETFAEADIVLLYGLTLKKLFQDQGVEVFMTRSSSADPAPVGDIISTAKNIIIREQNCSRTIKFFPKDGVSPLVSTAQYRLFGNKVLP